MFRKRQKSAQGINVQKGLFRKSRNVSNILTVGSEPVISFFNKGKSILRDLPFCISVINRIYVLGIEVLGLAVLAQEITSLI